MNRASAGGELVSLSVCLPASIVCVTPADTGRARQPETVDSGLDGGTLSVSCSPNQSDVRRDKVQLYFLLCSAERKQKGSASVCSHSSAVLWHQFRPDPPTCRPPVLVSLAGLLMVPSVRLIKWTVTHLVLRSEICFGLLFFMHWLSTSRWVCGFASWDKNLTFQQSLF